MGKGEETGGGEELDGGDTADITPVRAVGGGGECGVVVGERLGGGEPGAVGEGDIVLGEAFFEEREGGDEGEGAVEGLLEEVEVAEDR